MQITRGTQLEPRVYVLPEGIEIAADGVVLDGNGAVIVGEKQQGAGVRVKGRQGVTIRNLSLMGFRHGIHAKGANNLSIENVRVTATAEMPHHSEFLDIFHPLGSMPGGILLHACREVRLQGCNLTHQMNGLLCYDSFNLEVKTTNASYSSGFGFYLAGTCDSLFEHNYADFCCRWHARENGGGHMGADAAGFVLVRGSSRNVFRNNYARLGGDGFFLAGLRHDGVHEPCNENVFTGNDASWSPNISFEATFSSGNRFSENVASRSNYGFWLGFSSDNVLVNNRIAFNRQAGIAVENGINMHVTGNRFTGNGHGILLWSKRIPQFDTAVPENDTSRDWVIAENIFEANSKAIRIAADQDHGVRPFLDAGQCPRPVRHQIRRNTFQRNGINVELENADASGDWAEEGTIR